MSNTARVLLALFLVPLGTSALLMAVPSRERALIMGLTGLSSLAMFAMADLREIWRVLAQADGALLTLSFVCGALSYAAMARSYQGIAAAAGADIPFWEMFKVTIVASTVNYVVSTGGISGFAVRIFFFSFDLGGRLMSITFTSQKLLESCTSLLRERRFAREVNGAILQLKLHAQLYSSPVWSVNKGRASSEGAVLLSKIRLSWEFRRGQTFRYRD